MNDQHNPDPPGERPDEPQRYALTREAGGYKLKRRDFLKAAGASAAVGGAMGGCTSPNPRRPSVGRLLVTDEWKVGLPKAHAGTVEAVAFSPDGKRLASGGVDETVKVWSLPDGKLQATPTGHEGAVWAVAISPDGKLLASGDGDGGIFLWELEGEKRRWALFDPDTEQDQTNLSSYEQRERVVGATVCTCDLVCTCNTIWLPGGMVLPAGGVCVCNTIMVGRAKAGGESKTETTRTVVGTVCTCDKICTCNTICTCNAISRPGVGTGTGGYTIHYWYPN